MAGLILAYAHSNGQITVGGRFLFAHTYKVGGFMHVRDIVPTFPPDAIITIRTEGNLIEVETDDRGDGFTRVQLNADRAATFIAALQWALNTIQQRMIATSGA